MLDALPALTRTSMRLTLDAARLPDWMHFGRREFGLALTLAVAVTIIHTSGSVRLLLGRSLLEITEFAGTNLLENFVQYAVLVAALKSAERLSIQGVRRHLVTISIGVVLGLILTGFFYFQQSSYVTAGIKFNIASSPFALLLYATWQNTAIALIARAWLVKSREETHANNLLARMRSEQMSVRRRLIEGRLKAIQARVDPLFFFAMLEAVQKTYAIDSDRAEQLLDELTTFLRAALPRLRTASSSVDQECDLARSFARVRQLAGLASSRLEVEIAPSVGSASFPPGVLLPLIDEVLRTTAAAGSVGISFSTHASGKPGEPVPSSVIMQLTAQAKPSINSLDAARATLLDLFGATATLTNSTVAAGARTTVRIPYEPAAA